MSKREEASPGGLPSLNEGVGAVLVYAQRLADKAMTTNRRLQELNDYAVATTLIRNYFRSLREPPRTRHMVDVGAARGSLAKAFLRNGWTVDLFEPDPACQPTLAQLTTTYPRQCRLYRFAVGNENREDAVFQLNAVTGLSRLAVSPFGTAKGNIPVKCVRLGDFLATEKVAQLDFIKVDTEGVDFDVLEAHDFEQLSPALIFAECSYYFRNQSPEWLHGARRDG